MARRVLSLGAMDAQWQKLGRPAVVGFVLGLVVTAFVAYAVPAIGAGPAAAEHR